MIVTIYFICKLIKNKMYVSYSYVFNVYKIISHAIILYLDSKLSTRFFFDKNIQPISQFSIRCTIANLSLTLTTMNCPNITSLSFLRFGVETNQILTVPGLKNNVYKMETISIAELCEFTTKKVQQVISMRFLQRF